MFNITLKQMVPSKGSHEIASLLLYPLLYMQVENTCTFMWTNTQIGSRPHTSDKSLMLQNLYFP